MRLLFCQYPHIVSLTPHPHLDTCAKHLSLYDPALFRHLQNLCSGQSVENGFQTWPGILKPNGLQLAAVHKLDALAHLALLKAVGVPLCKVSVEGLIVLNAVDAVNRRGVILRILEMLILVDAFDERRQIEIILAEQDAHRLNGAHTSLAVVGAAVGNFHNIVIFYCRADLPQALDKLPAMLRLNVMEAFVADEVFDLIQSVQRGAHLHQLVQNGEHLLLDHGAAFQQDLAHCQNLAAGEEA